MQFTCCACIMQAHLVGVSWFRVWELDLSSGLSSFSRDVGDIGSALGLGGIGGLAILDDLGGHPAHNRKRRDFSTNDGMGGKHTTVTDGGPPQDRDLGSDPAIRPDPDRRLHQALLGDREVNVLEDMIEIADVNPVRDDRFATDFDVEITLHSVETTENAVVADAQSAFMRVDEIAFAEVHPLTDDQAAVAFTRMQFGPLADEDEPFRNHMRITEPEHQEAPVPQQVPRGVGTIAQNPPQRRQREVAALPRISVPT